ncbi:hypothetical protein PoB_000276700 [Plakobranchus ocellatus]|uniref:Uncharacterized protein n=1 Tax=Plakobranchus ocellatus TaxID=259542 RepID=A0AAV3Y0G7_9GAST|nr:hypothetical protein PoB_000276700 [Plakobranchus ocellatus]
MNKFKAEHTIEEHKPKGKRKTTQTIKLFFVLYLNEDERASSPQTKTSICFASRLTANAKRACGTLEDLRVFSTVCGRKMGDVPRKTLETKTVKLSFSKPFGRSQHQFLV